MHTPRDTVEMDLRPGGVFRLTMVMDDGSGEFPTDMRFTVVDPPETLSYEWDGQRGVGGGSSTITLRDLGDGRTEMLFEQRGHMDPEQYERAEQGWGTFFDRIAERLVRSG